MKKRLGPSERLYPMPCPLVVGGTLEKADLLAVAWINVISSTPPTVAMGLRSTRETLAHIRAIGDFTVNVAPTSLATQVDYCGLVSGRTVDKWAATGLHPQGSDIVQAPMVAECPYNLECVVRELHQVGEYVIVFGEIVQTHAEESLLNAEGKVDIDKLDPLVYIAGVREYRSVGPKVADAFSVGKSLD